MYATRNSRVIAARADVVGVSLVDGGRVARWRVPDGMTMTTRLTPTDVGVLVEIVHDGLPDAVPRADNETGTRMALDRLAQLVE